VRHKTRWARAVGAWDMADSQEWTGLMVGRRGKDMSTRGATDDQVSASLDLKTGRALLNLEP
jgi:hypothetical protein